MVSENNCPIVRAECRNVADIMRTSTDHDIRATCVKEFLRIASRAFGVEFSDIRISVSAVIFTNEDDDSFIVAF